MNRADPRGFTEGVIRDWNLVFLNMHRDFIRVIVFIHYKVLY